jgi:hypothetical protein
LLYTFRVLATGIHLMRTGEVVADLTGLGRYVDDVRSWQTSEPADDFTALGLYALTLTAAGAGR